MAKGKSQFANWICSECNKVHDVSAYPKNRNDEIVKEISKFCNNAQCRKHTTHKRKDTKKGN